MLTREQQDAQNARQRAYYQRTKEARLAKTRAYMAANPDKKKAYDRKHYEKNRSRLIASNRAYARANKEKLQAYSRAYRGLPEPTRPKPSLCELCGALPGKRGLLLDHCHDTGAFRGWLCDSCNLGLGKLGDTKAGLLRALEYLARFECQQNSQLQTSPSVTSAPPLQLSLPLDSLPPKPSESVLGYPSPSGNS